MSKHTAEKGLPDLGGRAVMGAWDPDDVCPCLCQVTLRHLDPTATHRLVGGDGEGDLGTELSVPNPRSGNKSLYPSSCLKAECFLFILQREVVNGQVLRMSGVWEHFSHACVHCSRLCLFLPPTPPPQHTSCLLMGQDAERKGLCLCAWLRCHFTGTPSFLA